MSAAPLPPPANLADAFEAVAGAIEPDAPAILCDGDVLTWSAFNVRADALARFLVGAGLATGSNVALYMRNGPDYLISFLACLKARLTPFNVNYRYAANEVAYLLDNADCNAAVVDAEFAGVLDQADRGRRVRTRLSARASAPGFVDLQAIYAAGGALEAHARAPDDLVMIYTGGTTGMPKGVLWPQGAIWQNLAPGLAWPGWSTPAAPADLVPQVRSREGRLRTYVAPPLMHGTGLLSAIGILLMGGSIVLTGRTSFDPQACIQTLAELACDGLVIVGDAFARPLLEVLRAADPQPDLSRMRVVVSSGMMWSREVKQGLLEFMPNAHLIDGLGMSESSTFASSVTTRDTGAEDATFSLTGAIVLHPDDLTPVTPGSGEIGVLAKAGPLPIGYYKDPERTARTFVTINGVRHVIGGDHALVDRQGRIRLLGRGNLCINTAGEKVYPEEVEEVLKTHPGVRDALVFAMPDPRFGQAVCALVELCAPASPADLSQHVRQRLAAYKSPRRIVITDETPRAPNGKADYAQARILFEAGGGGFFDGAAS